MTFPNHESDDGETDLSAVVDELGAADRGAAVTENRQLARFELERGGEVVSFATYRERDGVVVVPHVETMRQHRGNGHAAELMEGLLAILRRDGRTIMPLCPFAADHVRDNPQHHDLLAAR